MTAKPIDVAELVGRLRSTVYADGGLGIEHEAAAALEQLQAERDALQAVCDTRARQLAAMTKWLDVFQPDVWRRGLWDALNVALAAQEKP
jgi:hypothetical protein